MARICISKTKLIMALMLMSGVLSIAQGGVMLNPPEATGAVSVTDYTFDDVNLALNLNESMSADHPWHWGGVGMDGTADADPLLHITKEIFNDSTFAWTDYHVVVSGSAGVSYVPGTAWSDTFGTIVETGSVIDFYSPQIVPINGTVTIKFDIILPAGGFSFNIDQTPTPEPGTLLLLSLGGLALIRRKHN